LVPITPRCTVRDLMRRLGAPVLVAGRAGLGTINHCALTVDARRAARLESVGWVLSDVAGGVDSGLAAESAVQVAAQCSVPTLGVLPHLASAGLGDAAGLAAAAERHLDLGAL